MTTRYLTHLSAVILAIEVLACGSAAEKQQNRVPPPSEAATTAVEHRSEAAATSAPPLARTNVAKKVSFRGENSGKATFLIDAPLEKIKGESDVLHVEVVVDPSHLNATRGTIKIDLGALKTKTFDDAEKDAKQTEHAGNWLGLGPEVDAKERDENRWVHFTIESVVVDGSDDLASIPLSDGTRTTNAVVNGELWLHGVKAKKATKVNLKFKGDAHAPTEVHVASLEPFFISLAEHDIKPRDVTGKFLQGALERVGQKIDDKTQISAAFSMRPQP
jgi:hypothetical protein